MTPLTPCRLTLASGSSYSTLSWLQAKQPVLPDPLGRRRSQGLSHPPDLWRIMTISVTYPAVTKYAPVSVTKVADDVLRPEITRDLRAITARPTSIRKVRASRIPEVIASVRDVELLVNLIDTKDRRIVTRVALARHPKYERAEHLRVLRDHPWKGLSVSDVMAAMADERTDRGFSRDSVILIVTWCRSLPPEERAEAYRSVIVQEAYKRLLIPELVVDVAIGSVPGLEMSETGAAPSNAQDAHPVRGTIARVSNKDMNRALRTYPVIDLALAEVITANNLTVPVGSADYMTDEAVEHLLHSPSAVELVEQGAITDLGRLRSVIETLPVETRGRLARIITDPDTVAALIDGLTYRSRPNGGDLAGLLDRVPDLPFEARLVALSHANTFEFRDFCNGRYLNTPRPGELPIIVDRLRSAREDDGPERWYHDSLGMTIVAFGQCAPSAAVLEGIERLLDTYPGVVTKLLEDEGLVGRLAVERIHRAIGSNSLEWDMLLRLSGDWAGTLNELIATSQLL